VRRIVLDTNTVISALFWKGNPRKVLDAVKEGKYILLSSIDIEKELIRVLAYPKFGLSPTEIIPIINDYENYARRVNVTSRIGVIKADLTDNIFLECALDGKADYIVSGDHHLLHLGSFKNIPIVNPADFLKLERIK
jgi:putative PIN family toxin of toxin-antitoxin system